MKEKEPADNMALLGNCLATTAVIACGTALMTGVVIGQRFGLGVGMSAAWSLINLALLRELVRVVARSGKSAGQKIRGIFFILLLKFPLLYGLGYVILASRAFPLWSLLLGFSLWIVSFLGLAVWQVMTGAVTGLLLSGMIKSALAVEEPITHASEGHGVHAAALDLPELPNLVTLFNRFFYHRTIGPLLHHWETTVFSLVVILLLTGMAWLCTRRLALLPSKAQGAAELLAGGFEQFVCGILGPTGRDFTPFLGTLFLYIWISNLIGLVPLMKSPTTGFRSIQGFPIPMIPITTIPLAVAVFFYVQYTAIRRRGLIGYIDHLAGEPRNFFTYLVAPIMFILHVLGEVLTKPLSLSFRLFGNISSEDAVVAVLVGMGFGFLLVEFPILWLALILSTVQAVVFTLLSTIYIATVLPHEHEEEHTNEKGVLTHAGNH